MLKNKQRILELESRIEELEFTICQGEHNYKKMDRFEYKIMFYVHKQFKCKCIKCGKVAWIAERG
jgi:hypothetical protein